MNVVFMWVLEHPDVKLTIHSWDSPSTLIFTMTDKFDGGLVKCAVNPAWYDNSRIDDDYTFIFDNMYDQLKSQHKIGIMMEE